MKKIMYVLSIGIMFSVLCCGVAPVNTKVTVAPIISKKPAQEVSAPAPKYVEVTPWLDSSNNPIPISLTDKKWVAVKSWSGGTTHDARWVTKYSIASGVSTCVFINNSKDIVLSDFVIYGVQWRAVWSCKPSGGNERTFILYPHSKDGTQLSPSKAASAHSINSGVTTYAGAGTYNLSVDSSGEDWKVTVEELK